MNIQVKKGSLIVSATEAAVVAHFEDETDLGGEAARLDKASSGFIGEVVDRGDFKGRLHQILVLYSRGSVPAKRLVVVGLGKRPDLTLERVRGAFSKAAQHIRSLGIGEFSTSLDFGRTGLPLEKVAQAVVEGVRLGLYQFTPFKTVERDQIREIAGFTILEAEEDALKIIRAAAKTAEVIADAVCFARDIVSMPANEMTPTILADQARAIARGKKIVCRVLDAAKMKELGMNALLGVAGGSDEPPQLIVMEYRGGRKLGPPLALVGKGLTFDSGGISLKPSEKLDLMKDDMAGGAAVIAAVQAAARLGLPVNLVGLVPAAENLPSGKAYKPGDILKSLSGQTIEIATTDAEGRLILADALTYACRYKPAAIIDLATLTGACVVALGEHVAGMMGTDEKLKRAIREAADLTGERVWELPLWEEYHELIKGDVADYRNSGGRAGGAITAAAFLSKFTGGYPWVHLDIAGPAWLAKEKPYIPKGASGVGVRLLVEFLRNWKGRGNGACGAAQDLSF
ncbi:MAG: leucyl aminopeptidase [Syntrophobacterales bacterium RBG_19FT_COMBO_59_10]|nr:MAG: leucyl aminopeptidase [Syntrophobacterales bacterium RBG_19FT_COMBO_59_10]